MIRLPGVVGRQSSRSHLKYRLLASLCPTVQSQTVASSPVYVLLRHCGESQLVPSVVPIVRLLGQLICLGGLWQSPASDSSQKNDVNTEC